MFSTYQHIHKANHKTHNESCNYTLKPSISIIITLKLTIIIKFGSSNFLYDEYNVYNEIYKFEYLILKFE